MKEQAGLSRDDGKRPGGVTLLLWAKANRWYGNSHLTDMAGAAADKTPISSFFTDRAFCALAFSFLHHFYPRDAMLARVIVIATCPSVRPSVRHAPVLCQNEDS